MTLQDFIGEENLLQALGIRRVTLDGLREKGLPFINVGLGRVYNVESVCRFLMSRERVLNKGSRDAGKIIPTDAKWNPLEDDSKPIEGDGSTTSLEAVGRQGG